MQINLLLVISDRMISNFYTDMLAAMFAYFYATMDGLFFVCAYCHP